MRGAREKPPLWTRAEKNLLATFFESEGAQGCMTRMPSLAARGATALKAMAFKMRLTSPRPPNALVRMFRPEEIEEVIRLHDVEKLGFKTIGEMFDVCEGATSNAYYREMCARRGHRPAERNEHGHLVASEVARLREYLRRGARAVDIQLFMGVSASAISRERREYSAELKAKSKRPLPPPGGGDRYSGAKIPPALRREVERLYLEGMATPKLSRRTGVSSTHCLRTRRRLVAKLKRMGKTLPGCDVDGRRLRHDTVCRVPPERIDALRALLLQRWPVRAAAIETGIGGKTAYDVRDQLKAELAAKGDELPAPILSGSVARAERWLPPGRKWWVFYRQLENQHGHDRAREILTDGLQTLAQLPAAIARAARVVRARRPMTFEEQLAAVASGRGLTARFVPRRIEPAITLGGVSAGMI